MSEVAADSNASAPVPLAEPITVDQIFDKSRDIDHRTIGGEAFIITAYDSRIHNLNEVAAFIFDRCDGKQNVAAIIEQVLETFDIDEAQASADVFRFLDTLRLQKMIVTHDINR